MKKVLPLVLALCSCAATKPLSLGELKSNYIYTPIDPLPVFEEAGRSCSEDTDVVNLPFKPYHKALPDNTIRFSTAEISNEGEISFADAVGTTVKNSDYQVVFDYASSDVIRVPMEVTRVVVSLPEEESLEKGATSKYKVGDEIYLYDREFKGESILKFKTLYEDENKSSYLRSSSTAEMIEGKEDKKAIIVFPVYIGVGLRLTATLKANKAGVDISGLGPITAAAEAGKVSGSMVLQAIGLTGKPVRDALPIQNEITSSTIQNSLVAIGSIRSQIGNEQTFLEPRVLGFYNSLGGGKQVVNSIIAELANSNIIWKRPCDSDPSEVIDQ